MKTIPRLGLLALVLSGCAYHGHHNMALTERFATSDVNVVVRVAGTPLLALGEALASPVTMLLDVLQDDPYHDDHKYFSYAGSRTIARSNMGAAYQWTSSVFTIVIETIWLPITGIADIVWVTIADEDDDHEGHDAFGHGDDRD